MVDDGSVDDGSVDDGSVDDEVPRELRQPAHDAKGVYLVLIVASPKQDAPGPTRHERSSSRPIAIVDDPLTHTVFVEAPDGIVVADPAGRCIAANPRFCEIVGRSRRAVLSMALADLLVPAAIDQPPSLTRSPRLQDGECRVRSAHAGELAVELSTRTLADGRSLVFVRDVSARSRAEQAHQHSAHEGEAERPWEAIRANEQLLAGIFELLPVGIQIADRAGHIVRANPASSRIWCGHRGVGPELERVRTWWADTGDPVVDGEGSLARALTAGMSSVGELLRIQCFDGSFKTIINAALPLHDERGRLAGALVVDEDVTGLHETEAALRRAIKSRDEVLRVVSHDLRDPLQCVTLAAQQIGEQIDAGLVPASLRTVVDRLARSSRSMTRLVDDLLDVASIEAGRLGLRPAALRTDALVRDALDTHQAHAQASGVTLTTVSQTSATIEADPGRLQQALSNIVGNALKFTPAGGTVVVRADDDEDAVRFSVADTGPGIGREHVARVFDPFWQSNHADRRGRGLGLAIAKGIVEAHGGRIWLESELGRGTTVCFTVPKATTPA